MKTAKLIVSMVVVAFLAISTTSLSQTTSAASGNWSDANTWLSGSVPTSTNDVVIASGTTVTLDVTNAECKNLQVDGTLRFAIDGTVTGLTVNGNIVVNSGARLRAETRNPAGAANSFVEHTLTLKGDLTDNGGTIDFRAGSNGGGTANAVLLTLDGTTNSTISLNNTTYISSGEEFNGITVNKTGGAKVILASGNLYMSNNSSVGPTILTLTSGNIETGSNYWAILATSATCLSGGSASSYFIGNLGRGMSNSSTAYREFPVGDAQGYRPISIQSNTSGSSTGHFIWASVVHADASTGSSTFNGGIQSVSSVRYYNVGYVKSSVNTMDLSIFSPSYGTDDGFSNGDTDMRVAYSTDNRATWNGISQTTPYTVDLSNPPATIVPDSLTTPITLADGAVMQVALAHATPTGLNDFNYSPVSYSLKQNYPNPFNPSTQISFDLANSGNVKLTVYNILGEKVAEVLNGYMEAGNHFVNFNASNLVSGVYLYKIEAGSFVQVKKMILMK